MEYVDVDGLEVFPGAAGVDAPVVYVIDSPEHPLGLAEAARGRAATVARVPVRSRGDALTPWPAAPLRAGESGFGGHAAATLDELRERVVPLVEVNGAARRRAVCGYSLGGLFSLYAFVRDASFLACASAWAAVRSPGSRSWWRARSP